MAVVPGSVSIANSKVISYDPILGSEVLGSLGRLQAGTESKFTIVLADKSGNTISDAAAITAANTKLKAVSVAGVQEVAFTVATAVDMGCLAHFAKPCTGYTVTFDARIAGQMNVEVKTDAGPLVYLSTGDPYSVTVDPGLPKATNAVLSGGGYSDAIAASTTQTITVELFDGMVPPNPTVVPEGETVQFDVRSFPTQATQYMSHTKIAPGKYEVTYQVGSPQVIGLSNDVKSSQIDLVVDFGYGTGDAAVPQQTGVPKSIEVFADPGEIAAAACVAQSLRCRGWTFQRRTTLACSTSSRASPPARSSPSRLERATPTACRWPRRTPPRRGSSGSS